jgi:CBS domain-containing protein
MTPLTPKLVRDLMTVGVQTCPPDTPLPDLARRMLETSCEAVVVMQEGHALGVVGEDEIVAGFHRDGLHELHAADVMREGVPQIPPDIPLSAAAQFMRDLGVRTLFLMHHAAGVEYPAAHISYRHLLRYVAAQSEADLLDLGIYAQRQAPLQSFIQRRDEARKKAGGSDAGGSNAAGS